MDEHIDTGPILIQKEVVFDRGENTLETTYNRLKNEMESLFVRHRDQIKECNPTKFQTGSEGSFNKLKRLESIWGQYPNR